MDRVFSRESPARVLLVKCSMLADRDARDWPKAPPLGLLYISSALKAGCDAPVETRVANIEFLGRIEEAERELEAAMGAFRPHVVGLSAVTCEAPQAAAVAAAVKRFDPTVPVMIGGPHPTSYPAVVEDRNIDAAVLNEGEATAVELVNRFLAGTDFRDVAGISYLGADGTVVKTPARSPIENLDDVPQPDWAAIDFSVYHEADNYVGFRTPGWTYMTVCTSRGCPYRCIYCHDIFGKRTRYRSPESVLLEMETLHREHGIREFSIIDDIFNLNARRMDAILDGLIDGWTDAAGVFHPPLDPGRIRLTFPNGLRGDLLTNEQITKLHRAGTYFIAFAVESGSERIRDLMQKKLDLEKTLDGIRHASSLGIITCVFFMVGFPSETYAEMEETLAVAADPAIDLPNIFVTIPQYGTELHRLAQQMGFIPDNFGFDQFQYGLSEMNCSAATAAEFEFVRKRAAALIEAPTRRRRLFAKMKRWGLEFAQTKSDHVGINPAAKKRYQQILAEQAAGRGAGNTPHDPSRRFVERAAAQAAADDFAAAARIAERLRAADGIGDAVPGWKLVQVGRRAGAIELVLAPARAEARPTTLAVRLTPKDADALAWQRTEYFNVTPRRIGKTPFGGQLRPEEEVAAAHLTGWVRAHEAPTALHSVYVEAQDVAPAVVEPRDHFDGAYVVQQA